MTKAEILLCDVGISAFCIFAIACLCWVIWRLIVWLQWDSDVVPQVRRAPTHAQIAALAHRLYWERRRSGADVAFVIGDEAASREDWYEAERQIRDLTIKARGMR